MATELDQPSSGCHQHVLKYWTRPVLITPAPVNNLPGEQVEARLGVRWPVVLACQAAACVAGVACCSGKCASSEWCVQGNSARLCRAVAQRIPASL